MVKIIEKTFEEEYCEKRRDLLMKIKSDILCKEKTIGTIGIYSDDSPYSFAVIDVENKKVKALIENYSNWFGGRVSVYGEKFFPTAVKLAEEYEKTMKNLRLSFGFLERLSIPKEKWVIDKNI